MRKFITIITLAFVLTGCETGWNVPTGDFIEPGYDTNEPDVVEYDTAVEEDTTGIDSREDASTDTDIDVEDVVGVDTGIPEDLGTGDDASTDDAGEDSTVEDVSTPDVTEMDAGIDAESDANTEPECEPTGDDTDCDGFDDKCNESADEAYQPYPTYCGIGACAAQGVTYCEGGIETDSCKLDESVIESRSCEAANGVPNPALSKAAFKVTLTWECSGDATVGSVMLHTIKWETDGGKAFYETDSDCLLDSGWCSTEYFLEDASGAFVKVGPTTNCITGRTVVVSQAWQEQSGFISVVATGTSMGSIIAGVSEKGGVSWALKHQYLIPNSAPRCTDKGNVIPIFEMSATNMAGGAELTCDCWEVSCWN